MEDQHATTLQQVRRRRRTFSKSPVCRRLSRVPRNSVESAPMRRCVSATLRCRNKSGWAGRGLALTVHTLIPVIRETTRTGQDIDIVVTCLAAGPEAVRTSAALLSDVERHKARRFAFDRDARRFIVARARLRELLAARLGVAAKSIELEDSAHSKPALWRRFAGSDLHFNVSHCDDVAAYAFSCGHAIGIDLEAVRVISDADDIAARYFSRRENTTYRTLNPRDRPLGFFNCWTRKEAFVKALGDSLSIPLDRLDVTLAPGEPAKVLRVGNTPGDSSGCRLSTFWPAAAHRAA